MWTLIFEHHEGRSPTHDYEATREAAMTAFAKEPCLPSPADRLPSGSDWIHEIKLDGFRMMVRRDARNSHDFRRRAKENPAALEHGDGVPAPCVSEGGKLKVGAVDATLPAVPCSWLCG